MKILRANKWYIKENTLNISLPPYYISIERERDDFYIVYSVDEKNHPLYLGFNNLEDAVTFTEKYFNKYIDRNLILKEYGNFIKEKEDVVTLGPDSTIAVISNYFSKKLDKDLPCEYELSLKNMGPAITFYLGEDKIKLEESDLKEVFESYVNNLGYEYNGFKYIGGVHRVGYYFDEDTPYFHGIEISVNKEKNKVLRYEQK